MKAKAINVHNSDDRWDLHTVQTACRQRERQLKWKYISKKKIPADELWASLFFIGEGRHYKSGEMMPASASGSSRKIIIKNKKKREHKEPTNSSAQLMAVHSFRGSFCFFPLPSSCEWWWWRYSSDAVCALFIHTLIPSQTAGHLLGIYGQM